jgi:hypothetical protein
MIQDEILQNFAKLRKILTETVSRNWKKISSNFVFRETGVTKFRGHVTISIKM